VQTNGGEASAQAEEEGEELINWPCGSEVIYDGCTDKVNQPLGGGEEVGVDCKDKAKEAKRVPLAGAFAGKEGANQHPILDTEEEGGGAVGPVEEPPAGADLGVGKEGIQHRVPADRIKGIGEVKTKKAGSNRVKLHAGELAVGSPLRSTGDRDAKLEGAKEVLMGIFVARKHKGSWAAVPDFPNGNGTGFAIGFNAGDLATGKEEGPNIFLQDAIGGVKVEVKKACKTNLILQEGGLVGKGPPRVPSG
jgi:hypothetical protein